MNSVSNGYKREIPSEFLVSLESLNNKKWQIIGRVTKRFEHKSIIMISVNNNGINVPAIIKKGYTPEYVWCKKYLQIGDIISVNGEYAVNQNGQKEIQVHEVKIVKICNLTANQTGLIPEGRYTGVKARKYFHTLMTTDNLCTFLLLARSKMIYEFHCFLNGKGFVNCTTPVLQHSYFAGGARPFITHMIDNDANMFLRITSEIALKHIVSGGLNNVYEIGNYFRNGSVDATHNTPFMGAEVYKAYCSETEHRRFAVDLIRYIQKKTEPLFEKYGYEIKVDFCQEIRTKSFEEFVQSKGYPHFKIENIATYPNVPQIGVYSGDEYDDAKILYKWFKNELIKTQLSPVLITDLPSGNSPLIAKKGAKTLHRTYLVANGATLMEIAQSETDCYKVMNALNIQQEKKGDNAYFCDYSSLIHAYQFGIPPMCSLFVGIDRLIPTLLGMNSINEYLMYL